MKVIEGLLNKVRYAQVRRYAKTLPYGEQRKFALSVYDAVYDGFDGTAGENVGACSVSFECPYSTHVTYHCSRELDRRVADANDPLVDYAIDEVADGSWKLTVLVATSAGSPQSVADACAMSAVLRIPTVIGSFDRRSGEVRGAVLAEGVASIRGLI